MSNVLLRKLENGADLEDADRRRLDELVIAFESVPSRTELIGVEENPSDVRLVIEGFACRYKVLEDGGRQIVGILVPGDFCDLHVAVLGQMDHAIATVTECTVVNIPRRSIDDLTRHYPRITRALWWATLVDEAVLREWLTNMGRRPARQRLAHLLCELRRRLKTVGQADGESFVLPFTQTDLADTLGLTTVHINRVMQELRAADLISTQGHRITIPDIGRLEAFAGFEPDYLHLRDRGGGAIRGIGPSHAEG